MKNPTDKIKALALSTLQIEAEAILNLQAFINDDFFSAINLIKSCSGRVVLTGVGKSAIIAQKIVATLNSTGTPSVFMHAADAIHGDLGTVQQNDVIICISKSGNTSEVKVLIPLLKQGKNKIIAIVGDTSSFLAKQSDFVLNTSVEKEACPNNLAPTSSTAAQLAMGDALAVCLLDSRGFTSSDFAKYHPGGALGKKLYLKVKELAVLNAKPLVTLNDTLKKVIIEISSNRLGATAVVENNVLHGIITDGDIRRMLENDIDLSSVLAKDIMNKTPKSIEAEELAIKAKQLIEKHNISQLIVLNKGKYDGFIHLHDLIREGIF